MEATLENTTEACELNFAKPVAETQSRPVAKLSQEIAEEIKWLQEYTVESLNLRV